MAKICIKASKHYCEKVSEDWLATGSAGVDVVELTEIDDSWSDFALSVAFKVGDDTLYYSLVAEGQDGTFSAPIPEAVLQYRFILIGLYGVKAANGQTEQRYTTNFVPVRSRDGAGANGTIPPDPSETLYTQILDIAEDAEEKAQSVVDRADAGDFDGEDGETGPQGPQGEPGPQDFGRTHADGANMLAGVLKPHKGIVMWRAFVYAPQSPDRANQAYEEFMPLDGQFADNVIIQIKNGPIDFQPREPYSPLFTALQKTQMMVEFQITQEYLGAANHLVYLAPMWQEFFSFVKPGSLKAMAGVANIGDDTNWCGHHFAQANWYAFGRTAWNPALTPEDIAKEWPKATFDTPTVNDPLLSMMLRSREACVNYMIPLGIHHIFAGTHHYGPEPWYAPKGVRVDWTPPYYHKADSIGMGFNRTLTGTANVKQYPEPLCSLYNDISTCPENLITWFHHVPWDYKMKSGRIFWDELCHQYDKGVHEARSFLNVWDAMQPFVDAQRFSEVQRKLRIQARDAEWWRDACLLYFQTFSRRPIPQDMEHPVHNLDEMMQFRIPISMYVNPDHGYTK